MSQKSIKAIYHANFNGCSVELTNTTCMWQQEFDEKENQFIEAVVDALHDECDEDGYYCGSDEHVEHVMIEAAKSVFGADVAVATEIDTISS